jgi:flagellum-specific peptidoglycan hydrolase FlgJ
MLIKQFVTTLLPFAKSCEEKTGVSALVILAQAALESGWGRYAPGNMYFGVKDIDGVNGNEQLVLTSEYSRRPNCTPKEVGLVDIVSVKPVLVNKQPFFKYRGHAYFRKYETPEGSFIDHANLFIRAKVYATAMAVKEDPLKFIDEMAKHYATAPDYAELLKSILKTIKKHV